MKYLNVGCGAVFHPSWINVDMISYCSEVQACDLRKGIPYPDQYFDACYSSHVLEHLTPDEAVPFFKECSRVLKPSGILRIVVPDLEAICRQYLHTLETASTDSKAEANYDWMILELFDQTVRHVSGGEMKNYLTSSNIPNKDFIVSRLGSIAETINCQNEQSNGPSIWEKISSRKPSYIASYVLNKIQINTAKMLVSVVAGSDSRKAFEEGLFRNSGEIHRWMYDSFSLSRLFKECGFIDIQKCLPEESRIPDFRDYELDVIDGKVRIPQSLFMEGIKPSFKSSD